MLVRKITADEVDKLNHLYYESNELIEKRKEKILNKYEDIFVLEDNGKIIGEVTIVYKGYDDIVVSDNIRVNMEAFRILSEYQNNGRGQHLINEVIKALKEEGYKEITIGVEDHNEIAKHVYTKLGFTNFLRREPPNKYAPNGYDLLMKII